MFENDVKMYSIQTEKDQINLFGKFENDVKMYSIQTEIIEIIRLRMFENDVKMYSIQTEQFCNRSEVRLRMM